MTSLPAEGVARGGTSPARALDGDGTTCRDALARRALSRRAILTTGLALSLVGVGSASAEAAGLVTGITGRATATRDGETRALQGGAVIHRSDSLATAEGARLEVTLADGSTLSLGENCRLVLSEVVDEAGRGRGVVLDLVAGIVRAVLGPNRPEIFEVRGRVAVAAARSTDLIVETESSRTAVFVVAGEVGVRESYGQGEVVLVAGEGIDVTRGVATGEPVNWGQGRIDQFIERTNVGG